ncbi:pyridoxamine 5'-phosphate oxidase family protein [Streptomyces sp. NBC_00083]|uniref:pyridoxamine 5'-phosphate oxidase family protein n=1 Tax=Streptomyces sp. NBC_00083 TaxID=2975647 RepID=UPI00225826EE|nr:pyridoxamine 5'-phosphate oxidase family protein [Streptomyces sp. NBC_00083]MCX5382714.1 pyridoxamine 5'-phosphate oxidase family protein [Streptomyces sp. NBC_00083]
MDVQQPDQHPRTTSVEPGPTRPAPSEPGAREQAATELAVTGRTRHRRLRDQGSTRVADLDAILGAGFVCHLGVVVDGDPMVVPTVYGVDFDSRTLFVHGSVASRSVVRAPRATVCVTVTHVDGLVLARSVFEHGVNYRSAMIYAVPRLVTGGDELLHGLRVLTEHCAPGQWEYARRPNAKELAATSLLALSLDEASVKVASGPPGDAEGPDGQLGLWAGVIPLHTRFGAPEPDPALPGGIAVPGHVAALGGGSAGRTAPAPCPAGASGTAGAAPSS